MSYNKKTEQIINGYIEKLILPSYPMRPLWNCENHIFNKPAKWNYIDNCMIRSVLMLYELTGDNRLAEYAEHFICSYVNESGKIPTMNAADYNLDNICGGRSLLYMWRQTGNERYRMAADMLWKDQLSKQPRLKCGNFWHKGIYPFQIWLDGVYMSLPFMTEYGILSGNRDIIADAVHQLKNIRDIMRDVNTGLYYHGYDETRTMLWSDAHTGLSHESWLRSIGWLCAALADICELIPDEVDLRCMLSELLASLSVYMDNGMLYQLPAKGSIPGNYPETSGTLLYAYAAFKSARIGAVGNESAEHGEIAFNAVTENYVEISDNGLPVLRNICLMAGLGGEQSRDGSAEYYLGERVVENDAKGIAPYIMAYTEYKKSGQ